MDEVEGIGGGAGESVLIQDLLGQGTDHGLAVELAVEVFLGTFHDFLDVEGAFSGYEYVIYNCHIRPTFGPGWWSRALGGSAEGTQSAELGESSRFEDLDEIVFGYWIHRQRNRSCICPKIRYR